MSHDLAANRIFAPGSVIGIVGDGHLARMSAMAAASLGYRVHLFSSLLDNFMPESPAAQVCAYVTVADAHDEGALERFAKSVDLILVEHEDVDANMLRSLAKFRPLYPNIALLQNTRNGPERERILEAAKIAPAEERAGEYRDEVSVLVARNADGQIAIYDPVLTHHIEGRLDTGEAPAPMESQICERVIQVARTLAQQLNLVGLLAVELLVDEDARLQVQRLLPRAHYAGYWTLDGCHTDQFEQWIRAICNLPLGSPRRHSDANTQSLIGPIGTRWAQVLHEDPEAHLYLYGHAYPAPGSETGHITRLSERTPPDYSFLSAR